MKFLLLTFGLLALAVSTSAQDDDLPRSEQISRQRQFLLDEFISDDVEAVGERIELILSEYQDEDYLALYPVELELLAYWTRHYSYILALLKLPTEEVEERFSVEGLILPQRDQLYRKMVHESADQLERLKYDILSSGLPQEEQDFLTLELEHFSSVSMESGLDQNYFDERYATLAEQYPESEYLPYFKRFVAKVPEGKYRSTIGGFGLGTFFYGGRNAADFNPGFELNIPFNFNWDGPGIYSRFGFGAVRGTGRGFYPEGATLTHFYFSTGPSYTALDSEHLNLLFFANVGAVTAFAPDASIEEFPFLTDFDTGGPYVSTGFQLDLVGGKRTPYRRLGKLYAQQVTFGLAYEARYVLGKTAFDMLSHHITLNLNFRESFWK